MTKSEYLDTTGWFAWNIYTISGPNDDVRYIGMTKQPEIRFKQHIKKAKEGCHTYKACWIRSLLNRGIEPVFEIIDTGFGPNWIDWEKYWIKFYREEFKCDLTNLTEGGDHPQGYVFTDEAKAKMRAAKLGKKHPPEFGEAIRQRQLGMKWPKEFGLKVSAGKKGKPFSEEHKAKLRVRLTSPEHKLKVALGQVAYHQRRRENKINDQNSTNI